MSISKELLSEVQKIDFNSCIEFESFGYEEDLDIVSQGLRIHTLNIHSIANKCKEWASKNRYFMAIYYDYTGVINIDVNDRWFKADTEPEAIFKACQWILDNKEK